MWNFKNEFIYKTETGSQIYKTLLSKRKGIGILGGWDQHIQTAAAAAKSLPSCRVRLCVTPQTAVHQAPPSLGFSKQEYWSGLPFPSPMHESEVAQSCLTVSNPTDCSLPGSFNHGIFQARVLEWGAIAFSEPGVRPHQIPPSGSSPHFPGVTWPLGEQMPSQLSFPIMWQAEQCMPKDGHSLILETYIGKGTFMM